MQSSPIPTMKSKDVVRAHRDNSGNVDYFQDMNGIKIPVVDTVNDWSDLVLINPKLNDGIALRVKNVGVGGSFWLADGAGASNQGRWRLALGDKVLSLDFNSPTITDTVEHNFGQVLIPAALNWLGAMQSMLHIGDQLLTVSYMYKSGSTYTQTRRWRFGTGAGVGSNAEIENGVATTVASISEGHQFLRTADKKIRKEGTAFSPSFGGGSSSSPGGELTLGASIDSANHYFTISNQCSNVAETIALKHCEILLRTSGA